ncbi:glycosyltransferase [Kitasatospora sp. NPDC056327]|uniref:glycosyltransferase n=1 Tax=Kitasatospora sp. NPDC056327 TaxID=3345785 RepID=UPI0035D6E31C
MRVALLTEGVHPHARRGTGGWCDRLVDGLREHDFAWYVLDGRTGRAGRSGGEGREGREAQEGAGPVVHGLARRDRRPAGRAPGGPRGRQYAAAHERLVRALLHPGDRAGFGPGLHRLAELARADRALSAFLLSARARRTLERVWRSPGADTSAGQPLVGDVLAAADLLEQCLRPLTAPWYGTGPGGLGAVDLCHVVGGGPAVLPALVARQLHGVPFVVTEHLLHLREQYLGHRGAPHRWPVRALLLSFVRALTEETCRQAAVLTPGSVHDQQWLRRCGADPARIRVVHEGTPETDRPAAGPEPAVPTLVWAGALEPGRDPELALHAFALVRAELPAARMVVHGEETVPGHRAHCEAVAERLGVAGAVVFAGRLRSAADAWAAGTVVVFSALTRRRPGLLADAMLSGRAVVATDVGTTREVVGPTGLVVPPRDPQALAGACLALLRDEERRARLGPAGRLRAQERFAVEPVTAAFREIYLDVVSRWPAFPAAAPDRGAGPRPRPFARPAEYWLTDRRHGGPAAAAGPRAGGGAAGGGGGVGSGGAVDPGGDGGGAGAGVLGPAAGGAGRSSARADGAAVRGAGPDGGSRPGAPVAGGPGRGAPTGPGGDGPGAGGSHRPPGHVGRAPGRAGDAGSAGRAGGAPEAVAATVPVRGRTGTAPGRAGSSVSGDAGAAAGVRSRTGEPGRAAGGDGGGRAAAVGLRPRAGGARGPGSAGRGLPPGVAAAVDPCAVRRPGKGASAGVAAEVLR